jgi:Cdc6-like AAA superfamily ATPase
LSQTIQENTSFVRNTLPILHTDVETIRDTQCLQTNAQELQQHYNMMQWLSPTDFPAQQHDIISRRQEGTGQWLLDSLEFQNWLQGADRTLFCPGVPGAGKTMIAAIAIDHVSKLEDLDIGLAYVFCNYKSQADQSLQGLLSALLKQLVQNRRDITSLVIDLYDRHMKQTRKPSIDELFRALLTVCSNYTRVYIVIDALDECTDRDGTQSQFIDQLSDLQEKTNLRLLFTSRFIPGITEKFQSHPMLEVQASKEDVELYVVGQIPILPKCIKRDKELLRTVQSKIVDAIGGM